MVAPKIARGVALLFAAGGCGLGELTLRALDRAGFKVVTTRIVTALIELNAKYPTTGAVSTRPQAVAQLEVRP